MNFKKIEDLEKFIILRNLKIKKFTDLKNITKSWKKFIKSKKVEEIWKMVHILVKKFSIF